MDGRTRRATRWGCQIRLPVIPSQTNHHVVTRARDLVAIERQLHFRAPARGVRSLPLPVPCVEQFTMQSRVPFKAPGDEFV